jgi:hypothetical protein
MTLSDFQQKLQTLLIKALRERGIEWAPDRIASVPGRNEDEPVIEGKVGSLTLWIHPTEAFIGGKTTKGKEIDSRFEDDAFRSPDALIESFVRQVNHYLDGGSDNIRK